MAARSTSVTDRALRYRANATPPPGPKICALCGSKTNVEVGHVNGREEHSNPENLMWTCRSCNVLAANAMRGAGLGRKTHQYNPGGKGATTLGEWMTAVMSMKGQSDAMSVRDAVSIIRATSPSKRSEFASEIWSRRHQRTRHNKGDVIDQAATAGMKIYEELWALPSAVFDQTIKTALAGKDAIKRAVLNGKRNPESGAAEFYKKFHGEPSTEEVVVENEIHEHTHLGVVGILVCCVIDTPTGLRAAIKFEEDPPFLCSSEDGHQLYVIGGCQEIDLKALGMHGKEWYKERMVLGQFAPPEGKRKWNISYLTRKDFDQFEEIEYQHLLGEGDGQDEGKMVYEAPMLEYEPSNQLLYVTGGQYHIGLPLFKTSAGIEN